MDKFKAKVDEVKKKIKECLDTINQDKIKDFFIKNKKVVTVAVAVLCIAVVAVFVNLGNDSNENTSTASEVAEGTETEAVAEVEENVLEEDAHAEVNELIGKYYEFLSVGDMDGLSTVVDVLSEEEKSRILSSKDIVEGYQNIACYTKKGLEENSYVVFVYYEQKFINIETAAPGLTTLYVCTNADGSLYVYNGEVSAELQAYVESLAADEDVVALREEVKTKYEAAKLVDTALVDFETKVKPAGEAAEEPVEEVTEESTEATGEPTEVAEESTETTDVTEEAESSSDEGTEVNAESRFKENVNLRAGRGTDTEKVGSGIGGTDVTRLVDYEDGWSKISYGGEEAYCMTEFLE